MPALVTSSRNPVHPNTRSTRAQGRSEARVSRVDRVNRVPASNAACKEVS